MELDSVRELKSMLSKQAMLLGESTRFRSVSSGAARALALSEGPKRTLALGITPKKAEFVLAVRIQHRTFDQSRELEMITKKAKGEVDVRYIGAVRKRTVPWYQQRQRPLRIGCSVGYYKITAGTLGAFVRPRDGGEIAILSNNHVLANENDAKKGDPVLQPGLYDKGRKDKDVVACLETFIPLIHTKTNVVDCATATLKNGMEANLKNIRGLGTLKGVRNAFVDEGTRVAKLGRTTGLTRGRVTAFELDNVVIEYDSGLLKFDN